MLKLPEDLTPQQQLFFAIAFSDRMPEYVQAIAPAVAAGADLSQSNGDGETPLTEAILGGMGSPDAVEELLRLGADPHQIAPSGWSPWSACQDRLSDRVVAEEMQAIAEALIQAGVDPQQAVVIPYTPAEHVPEAEHLNPEDYPLKFRPLVQAYTNGINVDLTTADVIQKLMDWDQRFGITLSDIHHDRVSVHFDRLPGSPKTLQEFSAEIYAFCPDIIDQGFGCMDEMLEMLDEQGLEADESTQALIEDVDFGDENFGLELLARSLTLAQRVDLWWD